MSGFLYRGRHCSTEKRARPKSLGPMMDFSCDETDKGPPVQMHSLREFEQHLNDLKKENFSLKLRIYFLEERIQQKFEESGDDVHKLNIELKVEVESLKNELEEKQQLLDKALSAAESLSNHSEAELQRRLSERQEEICHMQEILETKVQLLQEEAQLARDEAERMASLADSEAKRCLQLEREMLERMEESGGEVGRLPTHSLDQKDRLIEALTQDKHSLELQVQNLRKRGRGAQSLEEQPGHAEMQRLLEEQQSQLSHYESAAGECVSELQEAQQQVQSLQGKIRESEARNQKLQERLGGMELELRSARDEALQQERNIQNISDTLSSKEAESAELYRVIEEQNAMLCSLKELSSRSQLQQLQACGSESVRGQSEVLALQASLFQAELQLQAGQRAQRQAARQQQEQSRALQRLEEQLQEALRHRREEHTHSMELQLALDKARSAIQEREEKLISSERRRNQELEDREKTIRELRTSLQSKEQLLEDYCELLEDPKEKRDSLLQKLRQRVQERDQALERAVDDKFHCVEEKEEESRQLKLRLREKERDLERQRCVLANNEETISSLEVLLRGKALELEQVCESWRSVQEQQRQTEEKQSRALRERDNIVAQLQGALQARSQEAQELRCSLLAQIHSAPSEVLEELKLRLQLKDRLFQEVLADRTHQAQEHQEQVQDLLRTISTRDQCIQTWSSRLGEVMSEQTSRLQELRKQISSVAPPCADDTAAELQAAREELRLLVRREKESREQMARLDALRRMLLVKDDIIKDLQRQLVDPSALPLVEHLTQEVQELRESLVQQRPDCGELSWEEEELNDDDDLNSDGTASVDQEQSKLLRRIQGSSHAGEAPPPDLLFEGQGLLEVKQLVEQKRVVERELGELKAQLEKAGFSSLSQMRKALFSLRAENETMKLQLQPHTAQKREDEEEEEEEEELDVTIEGAEEEEEEEEEESSELWDTWEAELSLSEGSKTQSSEEPTASAGRKDEPLPGSASLMETSRLHQKSKELKERLMVSEATVQAQAEQLKDYRELLTEAAVQQDSKQIQVDLQDLGYETCGRSENEAEREDTSSPEFDDLEMCTSLDCGSQWWPSHTGSALAKSSAVGLSPPDEGSSLQRLVEELRSQLSRSQAVIRGLQSRLRSLAPPGEAGPSTPRKVNWSFQASPSQSGTEDDEGWQSSSDGGPLVSPRRAQPDQGLRELVSRVDALEDQLRKDDQFRKEAKKGQQGKDTNANAAASGKFDVLIQAQARELSQLRQRLREGRGVCELLRQQQGDTTKAFEELLRANDIDFYMGQSFRETLAHSAALAQRLHASISTRDQPEDPDDKTELLAIRLSRELQQKDKVIESLRSKLNQQHQQPRSTTPCSSHTDQSDRISYVSDEQGSTNGDLELCSDVDASSELGPEDASLSSNTDCHSHNGSLSRHPSVCPSISSCLSCPARKASDALSHSASVFTSAPPQPSSSLPSRGAPLTFHLDPTTLQTRYQGNGGVGFSLADVHQELQMLQRQLAESGSFSTPQGKPCPGFPLLPPQQPLSPGFLPFSFQAYQPSPLGGGGRPEAIRGGASLLESSALWDASYGSRPARFGAELSSGSSGYQSGTSHTGSDLMKEHLREIRVLRERLEDSIQTNDRLRQQLEEKLARTTADKGAPTNIYIQGLDSLGQLSAELRLLKEENLSLHSQLKQATTEGSKEVAQLREAALLDRARLKEAELEAERLNEQSRKLQAHADARSQEVAKLKQDRLKNQEAINRLQHEVSVLQQQLCESRSLLCSLQCELQVYQRVCGGQTGDKVQSGLGSVTFDPRELHMQLEQQLSRQRDAQPSPRRRLIDDTVPSPPVRDTGLVSPCSPLHPAPPAGSAAPPVEGRHAVGRAEDFEGLQQRLMEGCGLACSLEARLCSLSRQQPSDSASVRKLLVDTKTLRRILEEAEALLHKFWRTELPDTEDTKQDGPLREEVASLRVKLAEQQQALKDTMERLSSSNRTKDSMEHFIVSQLSRTRDVLKKAKTNLQVKAQEAPLSSPSLLVGVS